MDHREYRRCIAFEGNSCMASGSLPEVAQIVKASIEKKERASILIFDALTSEPVEIDLRGTVEDVLTRLEKAEKKADAVSEPTNTAKNVNRRPGRPKLGVVSREVTLLPRHWDWLNSQPGGASVALRKLVEEARRVNSDRDKVRRAQEVAYRFMSAIAGNLPGYEEATRALFAGNAGRFEELITQWPVDIGNHARKLSQPAFQKA